MPDVSCMCCIGSEKKSRLSERYDNVIAGCINGYGMCFGGYDAGDYDLDSLIDLDKQLLIPAREDVLDGFRSLKEGKGSFFVPDDKYINLYESKEG